MEKKLRAKPIVKQINERLTKKIAELAKPPRLALISAGEDPGAQFYIRNIIKKADKVGIEVEHQPYHFDVDQDKVVEAVKQHNINKETDAILVQEPLPQQIDSDLIASIINPQKDVDGFSPLNLGKLMIGQDALFPCTPAAVMALINYYGIELPGKHTVLCGRSIIVGKPLLNLLIKKDTPGNATVTVCHSRTPDLRHFTSQADILIASVGKAHFFKQDDIKEGVIIIDVGTNEIEEEGKTKYVGDVHYDDCYDKCSAITPVPGGIGSITTAMLMSNIVKAAVIKGKQLLPY